MEKLYIRLAPDPVLLRRTVRVREISENARRFAQAMAETMDGAEGVGLAANQVGSRRKIAVIRLEGWDEPMFLVNPEIIRREGERNVEEACLSIPGRRGIVKRSERVIARATGLDGKRFTVRAGGLLAQALEHETDHLNGRLYTSRLAGPEETETAVQPEGQNEWRG